MIQQNYKTLEEKNNLNIKDEKLNQISVNSVSQDNKIILKQIVSNFIKGKELDM